MTKGVIHHIDPNAADHSGTAWSSRQIIVDMTKRTSSPRVPTSGQELKNFVIGQGLDVDCTELMPGFGPAGCRRRIVNEIDTVLLIVPMGTRMYRQVKPRKRIARRAHPHRCLGAAQPPGLFENCLRNLIDCLVGNLPANEQLHRVGAGPGSTVRPKAP